VLIFPVTSERGSTVISLKNSLTIRHIPQGGQKDVWIFNGRVKYGAVFFWEGGGEQCENTWLLSPVTLHCFTSLWKEKLFKWLFYMSLSSHQSIVVSPQQHSLAMTTYLVFSVNVSTVLTMVYIFSNFCILLKYHFQIPFWTPVNRSVLPSEFWLLWTTFLFPTDNKYDTHYIHS
jgi:hypothetical protein